MNYYELAGAIYQLTFPMDGATKLSKAEGKRKYREQARVELLKRLKPGDRVYTVLRHTSKSGMQRQISLFYTKYDEIRNIDWYVATLLDLPRKSGVVINGCGTDMGLEMVHVLGHALWPDGTPEPHGMRNGEPDSSGGYALKQSWI
jgi:hypothetical protein